MTEVQKVIETQLLQAAKIVEEQVDAEIEKMNNMDEDDFEALRCRRLEALKKQEQLKKEWLTKGHGEYSEITEEKEFFNICKGSENIVCHFYRDSTFRCKIVDKHLSILAPKHIETKFCKLNVEKSPFLTTRLKIRVLPTIVLCKTGIMKDYIVGFDDLGGVDDFSTEVLENRIALADVIHYNDDAVAPKQKAKSFNIFGYQKNIRGRNEDDDDDDDE